jgi:N-succinyldiaminopimelate aminotransferase
VVAIPPSVFYNLPEDGSKLVRFAFCKDDEILSEALDRMSALTR